MPTPQRLFPLAPSTTATPGCKTCSVEQAEPGVRRCYSDALEISPEEPVKVVLVDSAFIFELFWRHFYGEWSEDDTLFLKPWLTTNIRLDLLLLENQLPFSVLEDLFNHSRVGRVHSFLELTFDYFAYYNSSELLADNVGIKLFTDMLRIFHLKPLEALVSSKKGRTKQSMVQVQSATELKEAGVMLEVNTRSKCLMDLRFSGKVLEIPQFGVEDWTETLFRNLIALEQCHYPDESYFTDYVAILDFLINTSKAVDVLVEKGILVNWLGDGDSVAKLFNNLWKNITYVNFSDHYFQLFSDLDAFCKYPLHYLKATLRSDYGITPWQAAASFAGVLLLILSLIRSVCYVIQVVQQAKQSDNKS